MSSYSLVIHRNFRKLPEVNIVFNNRLARHDAIYQYDLFQQMTNWCIENEFGWRSSYDTFKFRSEDQVLLFLIRWAVDDNS